MAGSRAALLQFQYQTLKSWTRSRRVIAKAEVLQDKDNPRFIVTNLPAKGFEQDPNSLDRLILPLKPSMVDIRATVPAVQMVQENIRSAARAFVLWNMVKPGTKISRELDGLEAMLGLPVLKVAVPERIGFTYASLQGYDTVTVEDRNLLQRLILEFLV